MDAATTMFHRPGRGELPRAPRHSSFPQTGEHTLPGWRSLHQHSGLRSLPGRLAMVIHESVNLPAEPPRQLEVAGSEQGRAPGQGVHRASGMGSGQARWTP